MGTSAVPSGREETRERILQAAAAHFAQRGFFGASYNELIEASGLSKGACYHHFRSKQELAVEVCKWKQGALLEASTEPTGGLASPLERFFALVLGRARALGEDPTLVCLPRLCADLARDEALAPVVAELHHGTVGALAFLLRAAKAAGEVRPETDVQAVARTAFAAMLGLEELARQDPTGPDAQARTGELVSLLRSALCR